MDKNKLKKETFSSSWFQRTKLPALVLIVKAIKGQAVVPLLSLLALICLISFSVYFFKSASKLSLTGEHNFVTENIQYRVNPHPTKNIKNLNAVFDHSAILGVLNKIDNDFGNNIRYKKRIFELEAELKNVKRKLIDTSYMSNKVLDDQVNLKAVSKNSTGMDSDLSIGVLFDLVNKTTAINEQNLFKISLLEKKNKQLIRDAELIDDQNEQLFIQLEEAITRSIGPLKKMFHSLSLPTENIIQQIKDTYSGSGGPFTPANLQPSSKISHIEDSLFLGNELLQTLEELNFYRIAFEKLPFFNPLQSANRFTSGFGRRNDPITGKRATHHGADFAAPKGTPIYAAADGIVTQAGWRGGYGLLVIIKHNFGFETRYAHNSRIRVKIGQRVSRGDRISDMGSTGRSTGTHLHYEVRRNNKPLNPMTYIKVGRNVF